VFSSLYRVAAITAAFVFVSAIPARATIFASFVNVMLFGQSTRASCPPSKLT